MKRNRLRVKQIQTVGFVDKGDNPAADIVFFKRAPEEKPVEHSTEEAGIIKALARLFKSAEQEAVVEKDDANDSERQENREMPEPETVTKAEVVELQKRLDEANERIEKAEAEAKAHAERVEKMEDERQTAEYVTKAQAYQHLPIKADEFGPVLKRVAAAVSAEDFAAIEGVLKAADEVAKNGKVLEEIGSGAPAEGSAQATLKAEVEKAMKDDPKLTEQAARGVVFKRNPTLRREVEAEDASARR